jgi:hypothetical protein
VVAVQVATRDARQEADRTHLAELDRRVDAGQLLPVVGRRGRWPRVARRSGPSSTAACRAAWCSGSPADPPSFDHLP